MSHRGKWKAPTLPLHKLQVFVNSCLRQILCIRWPEWSSHIDLWKRMNQKLVSVYHPRAEVEMDRPHGLVRPKKHHKTSSGLESTRQT